MIKKNYIFFICFISVITSISYASGDKKEEQKTSKGSTESQTGQNNVKFRDVDFDGKAGAGDNKKNKNKNKGGQSAQDSSCDIF